MPTFGLFVSSLRPADNIRTRLVDDLPEPRVHPRELHRRALLAGVSSPHLGPYFINSLAIALPGTIFPLVIAAMAAYVFAWIRFKRREHVVHLHVRAADRAAADGAVPAAVAVLNLARPMRMAARHRADLPEPTYCRSGSRTHLRAAAGHLPAAQLHLRDPRRSHRGGPGGRREARADLLPDRAAAVACRRSPPSPSSSSSGSGTTCWWRWCSPAARGRRADHPAVGGADRNPRPGVAPADGRGVRLDRVPLAVFFGLQRYFVRGLMAGATKG